jgi:hypothetical protein
MRRCLLPCLVLLTVACKSPEERACENTNRLNEAAVAERSPNDTKSANQRQRGCLESLGRLRQEIQPDEELWFAYLRCLQSATQMSDQAKCLEPLTAVQMQQIDGKAAKPAQTN